MKAHPLDGCEIAPSTARFIRGTAFKAVLGFFFAGGISCTNVFGPFDNPHDPTSAPIGFIEWSFIAEDTIHSSPAIGADGTIYVGSHDGRLYAINPDGSLKWALATKGRVGSSPAIGADGTIYVGSLDSNLYAINPDGTQKWAFTTGSEVWSSPAIGADGTVYISSEDNNLYALNPDGVQIWSFSIPGMSNDPAIGPDGTIYIGGYKLYAFNPDGSKEWSLFVRNIDDMQTQTRSGLALGADGTIYFGGSGGLYAVSPDGSQKWVFSAVHAPIQSSPVIAVDHTIFVSSIDKTLYAINPDGTQKGAFYGGGWRSPAIGADGTIYVLTRSYVDDPPSMREFMYALNLDGSQKWTVLLWGEGSSRPTIGSDSTIYIGSGPYLHAIRGESGGLSNGPWPMFHHDPQHTARQRAPDSR